MDRITNQELSQKLLSGDLEGKRRRHTRHCGLTGSLIYVEWLILTHHGRQAAPGVPPHQTLAGWTGWEEVKPFYSWFRAQFAISNKEGSRSWGWGLEDTCPDC